MYCYSSYLPCYKSILQLFWGKEYCRFRYYLAGGRILPESPLRGDADRDSDFRLALFNSDNRCVLYGIRKKKK